MKEKILKILFRMFKRLLISFLVKQTGILEPVNEYDDNGVTKVTCEVNISLGTIVLDKDTMEYGFEIDTNVIKTLIKDLI